MEAVGTFKTSEFVFLQYMALKPRRCYIIWMQITMKTTWVIPTLSHLSSAIRWSCRLTNVTITNPTCTKAHPELSQH